MYITLPIPIAQQLANDKKKSFIAIFHLLMSDFMSSYMAVL